MSAVEIIVGSVYGSAMSVAERLEEALIGAGHRVALHEEATLADLNPEHFWLLVTSTTGDGELPADILPLFLELQQDSGPLPQVRYALAALGDSSYEHFCGAGKQLNSQLQALSAQPVIEMLTINASETLDPEEPALMWLSRFIAKL
ncbi:flavodoxin [Oceanisphaera avium]|uniref:Flavodoxin n=1 Tax=Oceanisphaera avium TaxID=1903694 RepID=A0A1Y0CWB0_9GAMM|nr:flavodoxin [Oceanisphaera avium]ART79633.1 flavodoxin [Oceanisphaera avium]